MEQEQTPGTVVGQIVIHAEVGVTRNGVVVPPEEDEVKEQ